MNKKFITLTLVALALCGVESATAYRGHSGGAVAGGFLGGLAAGTILSNASRPRYEERVEYVYPAERETVSDSSADEAAALQDKIDRLEAKLDRLENQNDRLGEQLNARS